MFSRLLILTLVSFASAQFQCSTGTEEVNGVCVPKAAAVQLEVIDETLSFQVVNGKRIAVVVGNNDPVKLDDFDEEVFESIYAEGKKAHSEEEGWKNKELESVTAEVIDAEEKRENLANEFLEIQGKTTQQLQAMLAQYSQELQILKDMVISAASGDVSPFWLDVIPSAGANNQMPANQGSFSVYGHDLDAYYHPKSPETLLCQFVNQENTVESAAKVVPTPDGFFHIECPNPKGNYVPGEYELVVKAPDHATVIEFKGRDGVNMMNFSHHVESFSFAGIYMDVVLVGLDNTAEYTCVVTSTNGTVVESKGMMNQGLKCPIPEFETDAENKIKYHFEIIGPDGESVAFGPSQDVVISACENGRQDGSETDIDCGGDACEPCAAGKKCESNDDCLSGLPCSEKMCQHPTDPMCRSNNWIVNRDSNRRVSQHSNNVGVRCDSGNLNNWYKFEVGNNVMPHSRVAELRCGTHAPGWINGGVPSVAEGVVNRQVCFAWGGSSCMWNRIIQMVNCDSFRLYRLYSTPACSLRYCVEG